MKITTLANLSEEKFTKLEKVLVKHLTLGNVLTWANSQNKCDFIPNIVDEVITQDEYTHDVIIPFQDIFLVYDTTLLGAITAVVVWKHRPNADEILQFRLENGWKSTPSPLQDGDKILGNASCVL